jgi:NADPH:quinone reductase-like Zn-dependent oxidoreductase
MSAISERLLSLSPEKRAIVLQRLQQRTKPATNQISQSRSAEKRPFVPEDQNFKLKIRNVGDLESLAFEPCPRRPPKAGRVEIEGHVACLNFRDVMTALDLYPQVDWRIPWWGDCAGKIVAVGEGVTDFHIGDEVLALVFDPFSAFITTEAFTVARKPPGMSFIEASAIPTVYSTAYYALHYLARLSSGERALIHSAAGGVGLAAIQIARWLGAEVVATAGSPEKRKYLQSIGVERVANSRNPDFDREVMELTNGEGVDVVLNSLAGEAIPKGLSLLRPLGRFVELGKRDVFGNGKLDLAPFQKYLSFSTVDLGTLTKLGPFYNKMLVEIVDLFARGVIQAPPIKEFSIGDVSDAFNYMARSQHIGKIALRIKDEKVLLTPYG